MVKASFYSAILLGLLIASGVSQFTTLDRIFIGGIIIFDAIIYRRLKTKLGEWQ
jgi:hypothetical protein